MQQKRRWREYKGFAFLGAAVIICCILLFRIGNDRYATTYYQADFRKVYVEDYSGSGTAMLEYVPMSDTTVTCYTKGPLSLSPGNYTVDFQYAAGDDTSVLKIVAVDYVSPDNSGGIILLQQKLDPNASSIWAEFALDQRVDNVFILVETKDAALQIGRITTRSAQAVSTDTYFNAALVLLSAFALFFLLNLKRTNVRPASLASQEIPATKTVQMFVFVMAAAVFIASLPLLGDGLLTGHDLPFQMARIDGIASGLASGQFPVRVHGEVLNNYGYPNSLFYPELLFYVPAFLRLLGVSTVACYKFYIVMVNVLTISLGYFAFKKFTNSRTIGLAASIVYLLAPYRLICVYYRSAVGEFTALTFLPLVLYGLCAILFGNKKDWIWLTIGATGLLQSHILTSELTVLLAAVLSVLAIRNLFGKEKRIVQLLYAAATTILLNLWFIGPMLLMMNQLGLSVFGRPFSVQGTLYGDPYSFLRLFTTGTLNGVGPHPVGWIALFTLGFYVLYRITHSINEKNKALCHIGDIFAWLSVIFTIATTAFFPWELIETLPIVGAMMGSIQFAYRCLSLAQVCFAILTALTLLLWFPSHKKMLTACVVVVCVATMATLLFYEFVFVREKVEMIRDKSYYQTSFGNSLSVGQAEYLVEGSNLDDIISNPPVLESNNPTFTVADLKRNGTRMSFAYAVDLSQDEQTMIVLPLSYIPNYVIEVDGERVQPVKYEGGRVAFEAPARQGSVTVAYREPMTFRLFEGVSLLTAIIFVFSRSNFARKHKLFAPGSIFKRKA